MAQYNINRITQGEFEKRLGKISCAFIPIGAIEVHGRHLPMGSDSIQAQYLADTLAEKYEGISLPVIPVGQSRVLDTYPGTLKVSGFTLTQYVSEVIESVLEWDIKKIFILQGHLGNVGYIQDLLYDLKKDYPDVKFCQMDLWRFMKNNAKDIVDDQYSAMFGHAGEVCTSVIKAIDQSLVKEYEDKPNKSKFDLSSLDINTCPELTDITDNGSIGNPAKSSAEKGQKLLRKFFDRVDKHMKEW